jgi:hypothetical protein
MTGIPNHFTVNTIIGFPGRMCGSVSILNAGGPSFVSLYIFFFLTRDESG